MELHIGGLDADVLDVGLVVGGDGQSGMKKKTQQPQGEGICFLLRGTFCIIMPAKGVHKSLVTAMVIISCVQGFSG